MCGIAGYLGSAADPGALVGQMVDALGHRGPDGRRVELPMGQEGCIALGNTRLAIIDLSEGGTRVDADTTGQPARRALIEQHALHVAPQATKRPDRTRDAFR